MNLLLLAVKKAKYTNFIGLLLLIMPPLSQVTKAQSFGLQANFGANLSQIDGDGTAGYNRLGPDLSLLVNQEITNTLEWQLGLAYSQRGALGRFWAFENPDYHSISLNYVGIPLRIHWKDWLSDKGFYKMHYFVGLSYNRLFNPSIRPAGLLLPDTGSLQSNEWAWTLGAQYMINPSWGFSAQFTRSFNLLYHARRAGRPDLNALQNYYISFQLLFRISG